MTNNTKELEQRIQELTAQLKSHENREYKSRLFRNCRKITDAS